ncbi:MAG: class I SAM-dependent methyltransferase [Nostoc sp. TH1S01]|nr:class I SAM-dependent methyltransferase [Nostoc sp. TH1S01]
MHSQKTDMIDKKNNKTYLNEDYWLRLHANFKGKLQSVGWPGLSEEFNKIKYESELNSFLSILSQLDIQKEDTLKILEVGVGTGFWIAAVQEFCSQHELIPELTAADISLDALDFVVSRYPNLIAEHLDLACVPVDKFAQKFDIVLSVMVLLHLTNPESFNNGLRFSATSVRDGGLLVLYEPAIVNSYSPWSDRPISSENNSLGRHLTEFDKILSKQGFERLAIFPGASWLTNSPIEAHTYIGFKIRKFFWKILTKTIYSSDLLSSFSRRIILKLDALIKQSGNGCSGKFLIYKKCY